MIIEVRFAGKVMFRATEEVAELSKTTIAAMKASGYQDTVTESGWHDGATYRRPLPLLRQAY